MGGVGSVLILLIVLPGIGFLFGVVGFLLVLLAVRKIADRVGDEAIFGNMRYAVVVVVVAIVATVALIIFLLPQLFTLDPTRPPNAADVFAPEAIASLFSILVVAWVLLLLSAFFLRRSFEAIADGLDLPMFATVGLLYLIGAATFVIFVGFVVLFVAGILQVVAFLSLREGSENPRPGSEAVK
ncbi:MAG: DUF996 domain-containing protein [Thermoplasmata archaeon]